METAVTVTLLLIGCALAIPTSKTNEQTQLDHITADDKNEEKGDLNPASSTWYRYSYDRNYPDGYSSGYDVSGHGIIDDTYYRQGGRQNINNYGSYDGYSEDRSYGYRDGYTSATGYGGNDYDRYQGYSQVGHGGYGGYTGNGGLNSYYGYNNPNYAAANHLGYGYYKKPGYGNIYNNGITPSLVTGYRGYSK